MLYLYLCTAFYSTVESCIINYGLLGVPHARRPFCFAMVSLFILLSYFTNFISETAGDRVTKLSGKTYGGCDRTNFFLNFEFLSWWGQGSKKFTLSGIN